MNAPHPNKPLGLMRSSRKASAIIKLGKDEKIEDFYQIKKKSSSVKDKRDTVILEEDEFSESHSYGSIESPTKKKGTDSDKEESIDNFSSENENKESQGWGSKKSGGSQQSDSEGDSKLFETLEERDLDQDVLPDRNQ